jgi:regulator of replication initiation timing
MATDTELQEKVVQLTAEVNGFKQKVPDLTRQVEEATNKVTQLTAERDALVARLSAVRLEQVKALFKALGKEFTDAAAAPYLALTEEAFTAITADMGGVAKFSADNPLFKDIAQGDPKGKEDKGTAELLSVENIYAKRRAAATGK